MEERVHLTLEVMNTLNQLLQVLDKLQAPERQIVKYWLEVLQGNPDEKLLNKIWEQIREAGAHMGFMDYADPQYDALIWRLQQQMLTLMGQTHRREP